MTRRDRDDSAELPQPEVDLARIEAGLRVPRADFKERVWARVEAEQAAERRAAERRARRNARLMAALWWLGPLVLVGVGVLTAYVIIQLVGAP